MKPFRISTDWIYYCFSPGADSGYPMAIRLVDAAEEDLANTLEQKE